MELLTLGSTTGFCSCRVLGYTTPASRSVKPSLNLQNLSLDQLPGVAHHKTCLHYIPDFLKSVDFVQAFFPSNSSNFSIFIKLSSHSDWPFYHFLSTITAQWFPFISAKIIIFAKMNAATVHVGINAVFTFHHIYIIFTLVVLNLSCINAG